jgi:hypothetical protein
MIPRNSFLEAAQNGKEKIMLKSAQDDPEVCHTPDENGNIFPAREQETKIQK